MSNQDIPQYFEFGTGFPENEFFSDGGPIDSLLNFHHNILNHASGRSVIHSSIQNRSGLRGRIPVLPQFLHRPIIDMDPMAFFGQQQQQSQLEFPPRIDRYERRARAPPSAPAPQPSNGGNRKRRASEKAISELKHMRLIDLKEDDDCCIICMEPFVDIKASTDEPKQENALQMPCGHIFGSHCLKLWLKDHSTCPTCRKEVDFVEEDDRGAMAANRRRIGGVDMRHVPGMPGRRMGREATLNRLVEVEVIVRQQRYAVPPPQQQQMEAAVTPTRAGGAGERGWMATAASASAGVVASPHVPPAPPGNQFSQYMSVVGGAFPSVRIEASMNRQQSQSAGPPAGVTAPQQAIPRPCGPHRSGLINRADGTSTLYQPFVPASMPQRSHPHRHSLRQSQHQPYPEVHNAHHSSPITHEQMMSMYTNNNGVNNGGSSSGVQASGYPSSSTNITLDNPAQSTSPSSTSRCPWSPDAREEQKRQMAMLQQRQQQIQMYQQQQQQQDLMRMQIYQQQQILNVGPPSPVIPLPQPQASSPSHTPATPREQCDYTDMSMCRHQYNNVNPEFTASNIVRLPSSQTQIVHLNCGHGFHRACLLSTIESRVLRDEAQWFCGKCQVYTNEVDERQQQQQQINVEVIE